MLLFFTKTGQSAQVTLFRELINFQNIVIIRKESILFLHESAVHYINTKNQTILHRPFYNLSFHKLKILHKYLNDALIKDLIQYIMSSTEFSVLFIFKRNENL